MPAATDPTAFLDRLLLHLHRFDTNRGDQVIFTPEDSKCKIPGFYCMFTFHLKGDKPGDITILACKYKPSIHEDLLELLVEQGDDYVEVTADSRKMSRNSLAFKAFLLYMRASSCVWIQRYLQRNHNAG